MESVPYERQPSAFCVIYDFWNATDEYKYGEHVTLVLHATPEFVTYITEQVPLRAYAAFRHRAL